MKQRNEAVGRLLKAGFARIANGEGKTAAVAEDVYASRSEIFPALFVRAWSLNNILSITKRNRRRSPSA